MFRQQTAATEEDLAIMKAQYAATQDLYEKRIRYLETRVATLKDKSDINDSLDNTTGHIVDLMPLLTSFAWAILVVFFLPFPD